jgi:hypothetical protein
MVGLATGIIEVIIHEYNTDELLRRLSDPFWFQAFSCTLGFDWHSSGTTTVTCGALKESLLPQEHGLAVAGGKGKASRKTLEEIDKHGETLGLQTRQIKTLKYSSKMSAKVDSAAVQDEHNLYHHIMIFTEQGTWAVIQQGMNSEARRARRYHWLSESVKDYVEEPHDVILGTKGKAMDMTAKKSREAKKTSLDLINDNPEHLRRDWHRISMPPFQASLDEVTIPVKKQMVLKMPRYINWKLMKQLYEFQPTNYEEVLSMRGVGPATVRALALISELIYGTPPSWKDPVKYSFTVGGKDGVPYPVDRAAMDESIEILDRGIRDAKLGDNEKIKAIQRLRKFIPEQIQ